MSRITTYFCYTQHIMVLKYNDEKRNFPTMQLIFKNLWSIALYTLQLQNQSANCSTSILLSLLYQQYGCHGVLKGLQSAYKNIGVGNMYVRIAVSYALVHVIFYTMGGNLINLRK